jgi:MFS family permease
MGDFISTLGSALTAFALGIYAFKLTGQATATAMVVLFNFLPSFLLRPIGGILADRMDRTFLMMFGNLGSALGIGFIFIAMSLNDYSLNIIYLGLAISSIFFGLQNPAYKACITDFVPPALYAKASGLTQLSNASQFLIAPILGGILITFVNIKYILLLDMLTFIFSLLMVVFVRLGLKIKRPVPSKTKMTFLVEIVDGFKAITANRGIIVLISLIALLLFYIGLFQVLLTPMALSFTDAKTLGLAQSICALGMLATSLIITVSSRKRKNTLILTISMATMGLCFTFIGITANIWSIIIPGFGFFLVIPYVNSSIDVLLRKNIDNEKQGRVWSLISVITYLGALIAYITGGFLADKVFNPLFMPNGMFANNLAYIFGVGNGRGISFIFFLCGLLTIILSFCIYKSKLIRALDNDLESKEMALDLQG